MKYTIRILILLGIFIGSIYFFGSNMDEAMFGTVKTAEMSEAELPTIGLRSGGVTVNKLYGYTSAIDPFSIRENLVSVEKSQIVELLIDENKTDVRRMRYEVFDVSSKEEMAEGTINAFDKEGEKKKARIKVDKPMESGKEYAVEVMLVDSESRRIYYYFRMKYYENSELAKKVEFIQNLSAWTLEKNYDAITPFLESTYRGAGSSYAHVNIKDSYYMVCWGDLNPKQITEPVLTITEIYSNIAVATLDYMVEVATDSGTEQYYVEEKFRVTVSGTSKHLLNYERTIEAVFDKSLASLSLNQLKLGVTNHTDMEFLTNSDSSQLAFVRNKELWHYNMAENTLFKVFSLRNENEAEAGLSYDQYDVRMLKIYENGDISFMVYGYMGKGEYEGKTGILLYRYFRSEERIEEQLYLPVADSYQKMKEKLGSFSYMNDYNVFFFMVYDTIYSYNLITKTLTVISDSAVPESVVFFEDSAYVVWQEEDYSEVKLLRLESGESGERKFLKANEGEFVRVLGKINENIVCSYGMLSDCVKNGDGSVLYPAYMVKILNVNLEERKSYQKEGYYVANAEITANSVCLRRVKKNSKGMFEEAGEDYILNSTEVKKRPVTLEKRITELMLTEYYIDLPSAYAIKEIPMQENIAYTLISEDTTARIAALEKETEEYMVYSFGSVIAVYNSCAEAIQLADRTDVVGTVINEKGNVIWERGVKYGSPHLKELEGVSAQKGGLTSYQEAMRMMGEYLSVRLEVTEFTDIYGAKNFLEAATGRRMLFLTGATLDEVLYFVFRGSPVYAVKNRNEAVLITGYSSSNVTVYEPSLGKYKTYSLKEAEKMFEDAGNIFVSYVK